MTEAKEIEAEHALIQPTFGQEKKLAACWLQASIVYALGFPELLICFRFNSQASSPPEPSRTPETIKMSPIKCPGTIDSPKKRAAPISEKNVFKLRNIDDSAGPTCPMA